MEWMMIKLEGCVLLTSLFGGICFVYWMIINKFMRYHISTKVNFYALKMILYSYIVPVFYLFIQSLDEELGTWTGVLFTPTFQIIGMAKKIAIVWIIGMAIVAVRYYIEYKKVCRIRKEAFECEEWKKKMFYETCAQLEITRKKVELLQNYSINILGIFWFGKTYVIMPVGNFTDSQMRVMILHELMHYKRRDLLKNHILIFLTIVHFFNPFVWILKNYMRKWSEYMCDKSVAERTGARKYFETILNLIKKTDNQSEFCISIAKNEHELLERVKYMKETRKMKKNYGLMVLLLTVGILFNSGTAFAATDRLADGYVKCYNKTVVTTREENQFLDVMEEFHSLENDSDIKMEEGKITKAGSSLITFTWSVKNKVQKTTSTFYVKKGKKVHVDVGITPTNKSITVGIIDSSGSKTYVKGSESITHDFSINKSGNYKVFVKNTSGKTVSVLGMYRY